MIPTLLRVAALGLAAGGRSTAPFTALSKSAVASDPAWLGSPWSGRAAVLMSVGETIGDKLSVTPSRLDEPGLAFRLVTGALGGALLGRRHGASVGVCGLVGAGAAFGGSHLGARWRRVASARFGRDQPGALIEDAAVAALAAIAVR